MGRLYVNITKVVIKGEIRLLTEIVTQMGQRMQEISAETEQVKTTILKYSGSNQGKQYNRAAKAILVLSETLYSASVDINLLQNDIVEFQNKSFRFEEMSDYASKPCPHLVKKAPVQIATTVFNFDKNDIIVVASDIHKYVSDVKNSLKVLNQNKESIGIVWCDPIYIQFKTSIEELISNSLRYVDYLEEYANHLDMKIKEYN